MVPETRRHARTLVDEISQCKATLGVTSPGWPNLLQDLILKRKASTTVSHTQDSVALGQPLQSLNILDIDQWYESKSSQGNVRAVIGVVGGEKSVSEETRKRRRLDGE
jgi:hypothetical protein